MNGERIRRFNQEEKNNFSAKMYDENYIDKEMNVGLFSCSCGDGERSGLSCRHVISLRRNLGLSYLDIINERWKVKESLKKKSFCPKKSRRHQISYWLFKDQISTYVLKNDRSIHF